jgi:hypothetical protein
LQWATASPGRNAEVAAVLARRQKHQRGQDKQRYEMKVSAFHSGTLIL